MVAVQSTVDRKPRRVNGRSCRSGTPPGTIFRNMFFLYPAPHKFEVQSLAMNKGEALIGRLPSISLAVVTITTGFVQVMHVHHGATHQGAAQTRLVQCGTWRTLFLDEWAKTWGPWESMARQWLSTATPDDLARVAKFHIPLSLVESIPPDHMPDFRYTVAVHQYQSMQLAGELRHNLPMPQDSVEERRSSSGGTAIWYTAFRRRAQCLPPTEERLVRHCHYNPRKRSTAGSQQRSAKPKRDHRLETRRTVAELPRQPYTVPRACMIIRALLVLTGDGLTCAETFRDTGMHLTPFVTPAKQWRPVTGATYMAANNLMQTAQSLIRGTVRGILAQRQVIVRVAVTWAAHVDTCARVLAVSAQRTRFWFHHSVHLTLYAAHRVRQRVLLGALSSLRRLTTRALRHTDMLELALRSALAHSVTVARANISHQQLAYQKFRTWAAMVTHKLGDRDTWLTAAMCDTLQLARTSQHRSMKQWRQESLEEVRA